VTHADQPQTVAQALTSQASRTVRPSGSASILTALHIDPKQLSKLLGLWFAPSSGVGLPERH